MSRALERVYFQKMTATGTLKDSYEDFGFACMGMPFNIGGEAKDLPSNDWPEYDGEEEYVPEGGLPFKPMEITLRFVLKSSGTALSGWDARAARESMELFRDYLSGRDGSGVWMKMYMEHTRIGRQKVRLLKMDDDATYWKSNKGERLIFDVTFKINDPKTVIIKSGDMLTEPVVQ